MVNNKSIIAPLMVAVLTWITIGCQTSTQVSGPDAPNLPFLKNSSEECYYLDEFMPLPDGMVTGKNGAMNLRYYTYKTANYKDWGLKEVMLSFYSRDSRCWSLFEEYFIAK